MTGSQGDLAEVGVTCPGWRAWRTRDGALAARKGGTPPGVQARGGTVAELVESRFILPYVGPGDTVLELGVGGGKTAVLLRTHCSGSSARTSRPRC